MKRWFAIILLSLYLCSTTELYQFLKIPVLIEHYLEHSQRNPNITVYGFLKLHYDHPVKDADWQTDQKLPFVTHHDHSIIIFTLNPPFSLEIKETKLLIVYPKISAYNDAILNWDIIDSIWQPPKSC